VQHDPVSVLIADVQNASGDAAFDNTFEQALGIAIEKATFISVYPRKEARALAVKLAPASGGHVTSETSQLIAKSAGVKVVLAGSLERRGTAFHVAVNVIDPANNKVVRAVEDEARSREQVLPVLDKVADKVRSALGETATEAEALSKAETFTTSSLGAMQAYARGQELTALGNRPEALKAYAEAVAADPNFGRAYAGMGVVYYNLKQLDKSEEAYQKALKHLNVMTEREQLRTLGGYYISVPRNYDQAIITYEQLVAAYPADNVGYANLALAYFYKRNFQKAMAMGKKAVDIYPKNVLQRTNVAAYAMYAGDFKTAIAEAQTLLKDNPGYEYALLALSMSNLASGDRQAAVDAYARLEQTSTLGASMAASGGIDLALLEGRVQDALKLSPKGIAASQKANDTSNLAQKYILAAEASLAAGLKTQAAAYAQQAVATRKHEAVLFPAALVLIQTGHEDAAQEIAATLDNMLQTQTAAYARLIDGATALAHRRFGNAIEAFRDSQKRSDSWFSHFLLGRAYMEAGSSHAAEALSELMACVKRHGEATDAFLADTPTLRYLPPVYYWLARAQETVGSTADAKSSYEEFLKWRSAADASDQLAADAKKRLEQ
jgi:tetratricopeptide (TPR) repeat protein